MTGTDPAVSILESRVLRSDGTEYDGRWWPVSDAERLNLDMTQTDILELLDAT